MSGNGEKILRSPFFITEKVKKFLCCILRCVVLQLNCRIIFYLDCAHGAVRAPYLRAGEEGYDA